MAEARKNVLEAQQELAKAQQALKDLRARLLPGFEASPHWQDATMRRKEAQAAYEAAANPITEQVRSSGTHKKAAADHAAAEKQLQELRAKQDFASDDFTRATERLMTSRNVMLQLEQDALAGSAEVAAAKSSLEQAESDLTRLREEFEQLVESHADYEAGQQELANAEKRLEEARASLSEATKQQRAHPRAQPQRPQRERPAPRRGY